MKTPDLITFHTDIELTPQQVAEELASSSHTPRGTYAVSVSKSPDGKRFYYHAKRVAEKPVLAYHMGINIVAQ